MTLDLSVLLPVLHATSFANLVFWTEADLYNLADEAGQRLARACGGFVERDASTAIVPGTASYALPARHLSTIHVALGNTVLQPTNAYEREARDPAWESDTDDNVTHFLQDAGEGVERIRVFPLPGAGASGNLAVVHHAYPATISTGQKTVAAPECLRDYFTFAVMASALGQESEGAMPEVAKWADGVVQLLHDVVRDYWGESQ